MNNAAKKVRAPAGPVLKEKSGKNQEAPKYIERTKEFS